MKRAVQDPVASRDNKAHLSPPHTAEVEENPLLCLRLCYNPELAHLPYFCY